MRASKTDEKLRLLGQALARFSEALAIPETNSLAVDGTIQRFEFCIELLWKTLRALLAESGVDTITPKQALQKAFQAGWLDDEKVWLEMLDDRNLLSHTYREADAKAIYGRLPRYYQAMCDVQGRIIEARKQGQA